MLERNCHVGLCNGTKSVSIDFYCHHSSSTITSSTSTTSPISSSKKS